MKNKWIFLLASCACLASCNKDDETASDDSTATSAHAAELTALAYGYDFAGGSTAWAEGASIGVYALSAGTTQIVSPYANVCYVSAESGFTATTDAEAIVLPATGDAYDVAAYYPYASGASAAGEVPVSVANQNKQTAGNVLYARVGALNNVGYKALLPMRPVLPQLTFSIRITGQYTTADAQAVSVNLKGFPTTGVLNIADGSVNASTQAAAATIALPTLEGEPERENTVPAKTIVTLKGAVMPMALTGGCLADVHIPGIGDFTIDLSHYQMAFETGYNYLFTLDYVDGSLQVKVTASAIAGWEDGGSISGNGQEK